MTKVTISKWGNSSAIRLPKAAMDELGLADGDTVDLTVRNGQAIIEKKRLKLAPPLTEMVAEMEVRKPLRKSAEMRKRACNSLKLLAEIQNV